MVNTCYDEIRGYVKEHHGWGGELADTQEFKNYREVMEKIKQFDGKKVILNYKYSADFIGSSGEMIGKVKVEGDNIKFYEGRKRTRYYNLDAGLFEGWFATLIVKEIKIVQ